MTSVLTSSKAGAAATPHLRLLLSSDPQSAETKQKVMGELAKLGGNVNNGRAVFVRSCTACHKVGNGEVRITARTSRRSPPAPRAR